MLTSVHAIGEANPGKVDVVVVGMGVEPFVKLVAEPGGLPELRVPLVYKPEWDDVALNLAHELRASTRHAVVAVIDDPAQMCCNSPTSCGLPQENPGHLNILRRLQQTFGRARCPACIICSCSHCVAVPFLCRPFAGCHQNYDDIA